ncbi:DUF4007 family protein [Verrucomicrobium sp. BvORR106]|uniref:DUF4007 family protein n=1 Tax=Verrucomicrobium sp. BvORR106 TaxID=1403819 RepID=UPI00056E9770|nr:DUF4007 family protein [Verrucomicrobium sp. BvORR106]
MLPTNPSFRYSGHETFACRYAWLPKVVQALGKDEGLFKDEDSAMVSLGVGKNMVRSAKFWAESAQIIVESPAGHLVTPFGQQVLGYDGHDPYLEKIQTLWLLHWKISTSQERPLFHWYQMLNFWHRAEFAESEAVGFLERELPNDNRGQKSRRTLGDGLRVFINSYVNSRGRKGEVAEDNLDCPLVELGLIRIAGERKSSDGSRETLYSFHVDSKSEITPELFAYCVHDYWLNSPSRQSDESLSFKAISTEAGSPGQVFKLPEAALSALLDTLSLTTAGALSFEESHSMQRIWRTNDLRPDDLIQNIYDPS